MSNQIPLTEQEFWEILSRAPQATALFYRLYYDNDGNPVTYTMEDLPGTYIDIDCQTFAQANPHVKVIDGKIVNLLKTTVAKKLIPSLTGTTCHPTDISVIVDDQQFHQPWKLTAQEITG